MPTHVVRQGETVVSLAKRYGIPKSKIIDHPDNRQLRDEDRATGILRAGDRITVPDPEVKQVSGATGSRHRFRHFGQTTVLRVRFMEGQEARSGEPYVLRIDLNETSGNLDTDGWLEQRIPADTRDVIVFLGEDRDEPIRLHVGNLDPIREQSGLRQRLSNLGYMDEQEGEDPAEELRKAVRSFQADHGMEETGQVDDATRNALREAYGE